MKFALLGNILAMQNVSSALKGGPKLDEKGFPYRTITVAGRFESGKFIVEKGALASDAVGLAATGSISLDEGYQSDLTVLVAPLGFLNELVRKIPLIAISAARSPACRCGFRRHPRSPNRAARLRAVGSQLFDILEERQRSRASCSRGRNRRRRGNSALDQRPIAAHRRMLHADWQ